MTVQILDPAQYGPGEAFRPNSWAQHRALTSTAPDLLYSGRLGSSKTRTLCEKADRRCREYPNARVVIARRYRAHLGSTTLPILLEQTVSPSHRDWGWQPTSDGGSALYYPNGSKILAVGLDDAQRILSAEFDMVLVDQAEELNQEQWDMAAGRLRNRVYKNVRKPDGTRGRQMAFFQIAGFCNPDGPEHFLFKKFRPDLGSHIEWSREEVKLPDGRVIPVGDMVAECVMAGATDNFSNLDVRYLARLHRMHGRWYERMVLGKWVAFEGMVYDCFDTNLHVIARPAAWDKYGGYPPPDWPRYRGFDFGYKNPFVAQWWVRTPDDTFIMYREMYMTNRTVAAHAQTIHRVEEAELTAVRAVVARENEERKRRGERLVEVPDSLYITLSVADTDAEDIATLIEHDIGAQAAVKDVSPGIQTCYELLQPREINGQMRSRVYLIADALVEVDPTLEYEGIPTCLSREILSYRYEPPKMGVMKSPKEAPMKVHDHACDCMRYVLHSARMVGGMDVVWL